ncbi:MAG: hypothetical protein ACTSVI_04400 [Promethearchaeota archaeon]
MPAKKKTSKKKEQKGRKTKQKSLETVNKDENEEEIDDTAALDDKFPGDKSDDEKAESSNDDTTSLENSDEVIITDEMIDKMQGKFWQKTDEFRSLLDPDVIKKIDITKYDLAKLLNDFFSEMFKQDYIDFRVSGIAVHSAAKIHRWKITEVLKQQEKEEEERRREMLRKQIPTTISQPIRGTRKIATQDDFMGAMRRAIIEVMRTREKQRERLEKKKAKVEVAKIKRKKKRLPESIRKAILGKERIEETFDRWFNQIMKKSKEKEDGVVSYFEDLKPLIKKSNSYAYRFELARLFLSLMFLRNRNKINVDQVEELSDLYITLAKHK